LNADAPFADLPIDFVGSFPDPTHQLDPPQPEIAFLGRSNVGKSSLMNALVGRKIAKTSATPGKTQLLNVFRFPQFYFLDLPGYGYARASAESRKGFRRLVEGVLRRREGLVGVVWLLDIRHPPSGDDLAMRELLGGASLPAVLALTKADKLPRARQLAARADRSREIAIAESDVVVTSTTAGTGLDLLATRILDLLA
jgi:GTP-binding protein